MLDRYSAEARSAVELAREEAVRLGHPHVGTEHLLLGLLAQGDNRAARALTGAGASLPLCREKVAEALASRNLRRAETSASELELTDRAARALDRAGKLSARLKSDEVETAHVLLSVLDVEGTAGQVLRGLSVDLYAVREALVDKPPAEAADRDDAEDVAGLQPTASGDAASTPAGDPRCPTCQATLSGSLARATVASLDGADFEVAYCVSCGSALGVWRSALTTGPPQAGRRGAGTAPAPDPGPPRRPRRRA